MPGILTIPGISARNDNVLVLRHPKIFVLYSLLLILLLLLIEQSRVKIKSRFQVYTWHKDTKNRKAPRDILFWESPKLIPYYICQILEWCQKGSIFATDFQKKWLIHLTLLKEQRDADKRR